MDVSIVADSVGFDNHLIFRSIYRRPAPLWVWPVSCDVLLRHLLALLQAPTDRPQP